MWVIGTQLRSSVRGAATGRTSVAALLASRAGRKSDPSVKALTLLEDLRRPRRETLDWLADAARRPELAEQWWQLWQSIPHPTTTSEVQP